MGAGSRSFFSGSQKKGKKKAETQIAALWQRMAAPQAGSGAILCWCAKSNRDLEFTFQAWVAIIPNSDLLPLEQVCKNRAARRDRHLHEGLPMVEAGTTHHRQVVMSLSCAYNEC